LPPKPLASQAQAPRYLNHNLCLIDLALGGIRDLVGSMPVGYSDLCIAVSDAANEVRAVIDEIEDGRPAAASTASGAPSGLDAALGRMIADQDLEEEIGNLATFLSAVDRAAAQLVNDSDLMPDGKALVPAEQLDEMRVIVRKAFGDAQALDKRFADTWTAARSAMAPAAAAA